MDIVVDWFLLQLLSRNLKGLFFMSISEAYKEHPELVRYKYLGTVIPQRDNYYAALNSAVFSDGSFCYIPKAFVAQWNFQLILESIKPVQDN
jgi:Fe-S cluster assembly protein SufB